MEQFSVVAFMVFFVGGLLVIAFSSKRSLPLDAKHSFILTVLAWTIIAGFSALPFYWCGITVSFVDALFESVSALTTTGISLLEEHHYALESLRFWRIFLQWFGGFGIILMAITLLPILKIGGSSYLMGSEFSDRSEKSMPRNASISASLMLLYVGITLLGAVVLKLGNLSSWDALYYSMSCISTGGIVVGGKSLITFSFYHKTILILLMCLGGSTLLLLIGALHHGIGFYLKDDQIKGYYKLIGIVTAMTIFWQYEHGTIIDSVFLAVSSVTTTGFNTGSLEDGFLSLLCFMATYVGACSGSTSGGFKIFRLQILYRVSKNQLLTMLKPYGYFPTRYQKNAVEFKDLANLVGIFFFYTIGWFLFALGYTLLGYGFGTAFALSSSMITNSGLQLDPFLSNLYHLSDWGKCLGITAMLCGRFEWATLLAVVWMTFSSNTSSRK